MRVLIDTSALLAVLDADDVNHLKGREAWRDLLDGEATLLCPNYVLLETIALVQRRLGIAALLRFQAELVPILEILWVDKSVHDAALAALLTARRRQLGLVDCVSFEIARRLGVKTAFAFDRHFVEQGFQCLPAGS